MDITAFSAYLLAALQTWVPASEHAYYEKEEATLARYKMVTDVIATGLTHEDFPNEDERVKAGLIMTRIAATESHIRADVVGCQLGGDNGRAWGPWQTQLPKEKVCAGTPEAFRLAFGMVKTSLNVCKALPINDRLSWYTDGRCKKDWRRSHYKMAPALDWFRKNPLQPAA